jgi:hypothetical protein
MTLNGDVFLPRLLHWMHGWTGRIIPLMGLILIIKVVGRVELTVLLLIAVISILFSSFVFLVGISRMGLVRALLEGRVLAVALVSFLFGYFVAKL